MNPHLVAPIKQLNRKGWTWRNHGLSVRVRARGRNPRTRKHVNVHIPSRNVRRIFERSMASVGCPLCPGIGAAGEPDYTVGGFFKSIGKAFKGIKKVVTAPTRFVHKKMRESKSGFFRGIAKGIDKVKSVAKKVGEVAKKVVRSKVFRGIVAAAAVAFPVLAPAAAVLETVQQVMDRVDKAKAVAKSLESGKAPSPGDLATLAAGTKAEKGVGDMMALAKKGDKKAQEFMGGVVNLTDKARARAGKAPLKKASHRSIISRVRAKRKAASRGRPGARRRSSRRPKNTRRGQRRGFPKIGRAVTRPTSIRKDSYHKPPAFMRPMIALAKKKDPRAIRAVGMWYSQNARV